MAKATTGKPGAKTPAKPKAAPVSAKNAPILKAAAATPPPPAKAPAPVTVMQRHLALALAEKHAIAKKDADAVLAAVFGAVVEHLKAGERVRIGGLGIIEVKNRPARTGRNPATGASTQIAASRRVAFRAAKELKEAL